MDQNDMTLKITEDRFIPPEVDQLYFLRGRRYRCLEVYQRVDDADGNIRVEAEFKREYTRFDELFDEGGDKE